jgi:hypothetical protein
MNIFLISPGRTGTHALSVALKSLDGFTSEHESKSNKLGEARLVYQNNHIESRVVNSLVSVSYILRNPVHYLTDTSLH